MCLLNRVGSVGVGFQALLDECHFGERVRVVKRKRMATTEDVKVYHIGARREG